MSDRGDVTADALFHLHRAGWSIGSTAYATPAGGLAWAVDGWNGENVIRAEGQTEAAAWRAALDQARSLGMLGGVWPGETGTG